MSDADNKPALKPVSQVEICGVTYDLACNGEFALVEHREPDAYGRPVSRKVSLREWLGVTVIKGHGIDIDTSCAEPKIQRLLDLLGKATVELAAAHAALQRESEPDRPKPKAAPREGGTMATAGILEEKS